MLMSELIQHVRSLVLRPDLADLLAMRTVQAVRALHQYAEYESDVVEVTVPNAEITYAAGSQTVGTLQLPLDARRVIALEGRDVQGKVLPRDFNKTALSAVSKLRRSNQDFYTYYQTGRTLSFKAADSVHSLVMAYVSYMPPYAVVYLPNGSLRPVTDAALANYTDWLMQNHTLAVMDFAVAYVAAAVGDAELAAAYDRKMVLLHNDVLASLPTI